MIDQFTKTAVERTLLSLLKNAPHYYLKSQSIENIIEHNGRRFYSKYRLIKKKPEKRILNEHLKERLTLAVPLNENYLSIEYFGSECKRFLHLLVRVLKDFSVEKSYVYKSRGDGTLKVLLIIKDGDTDGVIKAISSNLSKKLQKEWRFLPDKSLPESYNIFVLPRDRTDIALIPHL